MNYTITAIRSDGKIVKIPVEKEFIEKMHDNWKCQVELMKSISSLSNTDETKDNPHFGKKRGGTFTH